ncbi:hypothetical protein [Halosegnis sp.]|uniref:hypothetical protein n=1 Tax=Halosegnis sp. TaxID=2864959 RepID=UPI0035D3FBD0
MRQVSGCDFCGNTASGAFEVLPAEHDPDGDGKRMILCDGCRDRLASVLDPLIDAAATDVEPEVEDTGKSEQADESADIDADETEDERAGSMAATGAGTSSRVPKGYRKVMRFLESREFPLAREEAVEMAAGAYDLEASAVEAALEHADAHDRLTVSQDQIRDP